MGRLLPRITLVLAFAIFAVFFPPLPAPASEMKPDWRTEWEKTLAEAKKEGQVTVYVWSTVEPAVAAFQQAYPEIKLVTVSGTGNLVPRLLSERTAGKYLADISISGVTSNYRILHGRKVLDPIKPVLILPEVADESKWWKGKHKYLDPEGRHIFVFVGAPETGSKFYNDRLVNPQGFTSFSDFLDPRWRGKIAVRDARLPGPGSDPLRFFYHNPQIGPHFIRRLFGEMDVTLFQDTRQAVDWLAGGKFAICFFCASSEVFKAKQQGLPVDAFGYMKEGAAVTSRAGTIGLLNKAPHPNAAKVFINWFLSREGQLAFLKNIVDSPDSLRIDIPKDQVPPVNRRMEGVDYMEVDVPGRLEWEPVLKVLEEVLGKTEKK